MVRDCKEGGRASTGWLKSLWAFDLSLLEAIHRERREGGSWSTGLLKDVHSILRCWSDVGRWSTGLLNFGQCRSRESRQGGRWSTDWLNLPPITRWRREWGSLSTGWLNSPLTCRYVREGGRLLRGCPNLGQVKLRDFKEAGRRSTGWLKWIHLSSTRREREEGSLLRGLLNSDLLNTSSWSSGGSWSTERVNDSPNWRLRRDWGRLLRSSRKLLPKTIVVRFGVVSCRVRISFVARKTREGGRRGI